jgi:DNA mismatch repair protein MutL
MNRIRLLPEQVANQIAAGEVVERPASVVKELVENALDAGASKIIVETQAGGRGLIRVTDDGAGMSRDDALLCLERHATSKIQRAEDLRSIATMGFRGEALPSIASVSRFTLTTREREGGASEGTQVIVHGGRIQEVKAAGSPPGASIEVRQLFYNLPARRKFLRAEETESARIQHYMTVAALACPEVAFVFVKEGRTVWQLPAIPPGSTAQSRIAALGERHRALMGGGWKMIAVDYAAALPGAEEVEEPPGREEARAGEDKVRVWGLTGSPGVSRSNRDDQHLFVNRRPIENRGLNFALLEGYHTALMKGRYPVCCLFIEVDPAEADVNIHPSKREVKFHRERAVRQIVTQAVRQTLLAYHQGGGPPLRTAAVPAVEAAGPAPALPPPAELLFAPAPGPELEGKFNLELRNSGKDQIPPPPGLELERAGVSPAPIAAPDETPAPSGFRGKPEIRNLEAAPPAAPQPRILPAVAGGVPPAPVPEPAALLKVPLRLIGVVGRLYVLLESDRGLVLIDQHAAHERILFEQMMTRLESNKEAPSQRLLLPETVELGARDARFLQENMGALNRLGVGLSGFGEGTFLLDALPPFVKARDARQFVIGLVDELKTAGQGVNTLRLGELMVAKTVCRHAVKANDPLAREELENLVRDLRHCQMPYTCPHGRPTIIETSFRELEKKFGRIQ